LHDPPQIPRGDGQGEQQYGDDPDPGDQRVFVFDWLRILVQIGWRGLWRVIRVLHHCMVVIVLIIAGAVQGKAVQDALQNRPYRVNSLWFLFGP
jgi:hypothetical protein